ASSSDNRPFRCRVSCDLPRRADRPSRWFRSKRLAREERPFPPQRTQSESPRLGSGSVPGVRCRPRLIPLNLTKGNRLVGIAPPAQDGTKLQVKHTWRPEERGPLRSILDQ